MFNNSINTTARLCLVFLPCGVSMKGEKNLPKSASPRPDFQLV